MSSKHDYHPKFHINSTGTAPSIRPFSSAFSLHSHESSDCIIEWTALIRPAHHPPSPFRRMCTFNYISYSRITVGSSQDIALCTFNFIDIDVAACTNWSSCRNFYRTYVIFLHAREVEIFNLTVRLSRGRKYIYTGAFLLFIRRQECNHKKCKGNSNGNWKIAGKGIK